jgi:O-antigen/teichoic acid export membrane protein
MSIAKHTGYNIAGALSPLAVSLLTVPLYIRVVGVERYGILALCWLVLGFMGFLNLGMGPAVAQRLASLRDGTDRERGEAFWTGIWLNILLGAIGALIVYVFADAYFKRMLLSSTALGLEIRGSVGWLALMVPLALLSSVASGALMGRERFLVLNLIGSASSVLMALLPLGWAMVAGPELGGLLAAALVGRALALAMMLVACSRAVPIRQIHRPVPALMGKLLSFGGWVTVSSLITPLISTIDQFMIGAWIGAAAVSVYSIPYNVVSRVTILPGSLASALFPRFAATETEAAAELQAESLASLLALMTPAAIALLAILGPFLRVWIGRELADQSTVIAYILLAGFWINSTAHIPYAYLQASGRPDLIAKLHLAYLLPYFALLYLGLSWLGLAGAALAWSIRSFFDPVLYIFAGSFRRVLPIILPQGLVVLAATIAAAVFPWTGWLHWLLIIGLFALSTILSFRMLPHSARGQIDRLLVLLPRGLRPAVSVAPTAARPEKP